MTKAELIKALEPYSDHVPIAVSVQGSKLVKLDEIIIAYETNPSNTLGVPCIAILGEYQCQT